MLLVDTSEPEDIFQLIKQSVEVQRVPLNQRDMADFYFGGADCKTRQFSRKQAGELLSDIDEAEKQLHDYYNNADFNNQIVEGIISPVPLVKRNRQVTVRMSAVSSGSLYSYSVAETGYIYNERVHSLHLSILDAWLYRLSESGVGTFFTINASATAKFLVATYKNCNKAVEEHTTLQRCIRPRIAVKDYSPLTIALMSLSTAYKIGVGEEKAQLLSCQYKSLFDIAEAPVEELAKTGIGNKTAQKLIKAIGREE